MSSESNSYGEHLYKTYANQPDQPFVKQDVEIRKVKVNEDSSMTKAHWFIIGTTFGIFLGSLVVGIILI